MDIRSLGLGADRDAFAGARRWVALVLAVFFVLIHLYAGFYGAPSSMLYRMLHLTLALALVIVMFPLRVPPGWHWPGRLLDLVLFAATLWLIWYYLATFDRWELRTVRMSPTDSFAAWLTLGLIFEAVRRTVGTIILAVAVFFCVHALYANHFPGVFYGPPTTVRGLLRTLLVGDNGVFGIPLLVMAQYVVLFIFFGQMLGVVGVGGFFLRLAFALFGHRTGGPAKAAVVSSAFMGSLSGSAIGNVLTTGSFTIPLMRRLGYRGSFAGGVEAAASTGGMIMPPVMGAIAFIMAEFMGRPYAEVALAALVPALLYFLAIFVAVHLEAKRTGLQTVSRALLPRVGAVLWQQGYLLIPVVLVVGTLVAGYSIIFVAVVAIAGTFLVGFLRRATWPTAPKMLLAAEATARSTVGLSATAACAGIIIGAIFATGLSFRLSQAALSAADGQLWLVLLISGAMALVLGMGMTASAVYITMVATVIPILRAAGVPEMAAHMFALYFGVVSNITPPVALAAFAAAPLARADPMRTGLEAAKLGIAAFLIPVMFVYQPALVLEGTPLQTAQSAASAAIGLTAISAAFVGYLFTPLGTLWRLGLLAGGLAMVVPQGVTDLAGLAAVLGLGALNWRGFGAGRAVAAEERAAAAPAATGLLARLAEARLRRARREEGLGTGPGIASDRDAAGPDLRSLADPAAAEAETRPLRRELAWPLWVLLAASALAVELMGQALLHNRQPMMWLAGLMAVSVVFTVGVRLLLGRADRLEPKEAPA